MTATHRRWVAIATLALLPLVWLWPCVFGGRTFVPYDLAEFPPASFALDAAELTAVQRGKNHDVTEVPVWFAPEMQLAGGEVLAGRLPLWNPHARGGAPLHAHGLIGLCYPPNWLALFAGDPASRLVFLAWISLALGGLLTFGLLRELGVSMAAAWFGAALFELSAPMAVNAFFWMRLASFVWLPGVLWALLRLARDERLRPLPLAAVAVSFAMTWLGGFPPFATTTSVIGGLFATWLVVSHARQRGGRAGARLGVRLGTGVLLGAMLAMPQVLPSLLFFPESARTPDPPLAAMGSQSFEPYGLLGYLAPDLISHPTATHEIPYGQSPLALLLQTRLEPSGKAALPNYNYTEYAVFVGSFGLLLAIVGLLAGRGRHRGFAVCGFFLLLCLALFVPGVHLLFTLPVIKNVWPMRWLAPATLFVCWLAALGCERLRDKRTLLPVAVCVVSIAIVMLLQFRVGMLYSPSFSGPVPMIAAQYGCSEQAVIDHVQGVPPAPMNRFEMAWSRARAQLGTAWTWLVAAGVWSIAIALIRSVRGRAWLLCAAGVATIVQLALHGAPIVRGCELTHTTDTPIHTFLRERAAEAAPQGGFTIARASIEPALQSQLPPGQLMVPGIRDLHFYSHFDGRSHQPLQAMLGPWWGPRTAAKGYLTLSLPSVLPTASEPPPAVPYPFTSPLEHPLLDLLGVRYLLATEALQHAGTPVGPVLPRGEFFVYERPHALPRAFSVPRLRVLPADDDVIAALAAPDLQPRAAALVVQADVPVHPPDDPATADPRRIRFVSDHPTVVELDVAAGAAPWLVLTDTWLPGWTATVDGATVPLLRTNHSQRLIRLPVNACSVRFAYTCPGLAAGSTLAGIATLVLLLFTWRQRRLDAARTAR